MKKKIWCYGLSLIVVSFISACKKDATEVASGLQTTGKVASTRGSNSVTALESKNANIQLYEGNWYDFEPDNNTWAKASTLKKGVSYIGKLGTENDEDCYVIDLASLTGTSYSIKLEGPLGYKFMASVGMNPYNPLYTKELYEFQVLNPRKKLYLKVKMQRYAHEEEYKWDPNATYRIRFDDWNIKLPQ